MKKILLFSLLATLASCAPKADNEMKEICHEVIKINRGVLIRFEPVEAEAKK